MAMCVCVWLLTGVLPAVTSLGLNEEELASVSIVVAAPSVGRAAGCVVVRRHREGIVASRPQTTTSSRAVATNPVDVVKQLLQLLRHGAVAVAVAIAVELSCAVGLQ